MIKLNKELTEKHKHRYKRYRARNEHKDATLLVGYGFMWAFVTLILLATTSNTRPVVILLLAFIILLLKNIYVIYFKCPNKYQQGNSYVKRKWKIVGGFINIYSIVTMCIMVYIGFKNIVAGMILSIVFYSIILITHRWLVNKVWYEIDKKYYLEIDKKNPYQKRYLNEPKYYWSRINNNGDDEIK